MGAESARTPLDQRQRELIDRLVAAVPPLLARAYGESLLAVVLLNPAEEPGWIYQALGRDSVAEARLPFRWIEQAFEADGELAERLTDLVEGGALDANLARVVANCA